ncbi:MAG: cardiolipin synthase [Candidatus Saccharibacteria bacterium]
MIVGLLTLLFYVVFVISLIRLIADNREPTKTIAWLLVMLFLPVIGFLLYMALGRDWRNAKRKQRDSKKLEHSSRRKFMSKLYSENKNSGVNLSSWSKSAIKLTTSNNKTQILMADSVKIFDNGQEKFDSLMEDISNAKSFINLEYFIWEKDELTKQIFDILSKKIKDGIEVRIIYDFIGSIKYSKSELRKLKRMGAKVHAQARDFRKLNYRNHRKIAVIDGLIGYTGGMNMGQEYIDGGGRYKTWRDTHLRVTGKAVYSLQDVFSRDWQKRTGEDLYKDKFFPSDAKTGNIITQLSYLGSELEFEATKQLYLSAITNARDKIYIQSPYFIPDETLLDALVTSALSGVDVRVMITGVPDKKAPWWAAQSFFAGLLAGGVKFYLYDDGFFHSKTLVKDNDMVSIGTTNFDIRSFSLQQEDTLLIFDSKLISEHYQIFNKDLKGCRQVTLDIIKKESFLIKFRNSLSRLLANLY